MPPGGKGGPANRPESLREYVPLPGRFCLGPATPRGQDVETSGKLREVNHESPKRFGVDKWPRHGQCCIPDRKHNSPGTGMPHDQIDRVTQVRESQIDGPASLL